jgi:hypothetical protein
MFYKKVVLNIFIAAMSATYAVGSPNIKAKAAVSEIAAVQLAPVGIKDELEDNNLKQILADVIKIKEGKIGEIIRKFLSNSPQWVWIIYDDDLPGDVNAQTQLTSEGAITLLDYDKLQVATNLSVARTIIHEMIHAYLTLYFRYDGPTASNDYPAISNAWVISDYPDYNKIQHDEIERSFIDEIASALDEYGDTAGLSKVNKEVYTDLAWGGLDFQNNIELSWAIKKRIQSRLLAEQLNESFGTERPVAFK